MDSKTDIAGTLTVKPKSDLHELDGTVAVNFKTNTKDLKGVIAPKEYKNNKDLNGTAFVIKYNNISYLNGKMYVSFPYNGVIGDIDGKVTVRRSNDSSINGKVSVSVTNESYISGVVNTKTYADDYNLQGTVTTKTYNSSSDLAGTMFVHNFNKDYSDLITIVDTKSKKADYSVIQTGVEDSITDSDLLSNIRSINNDKNKFKIVVDDKGKYIYDMKSSSSINISDGKTVLDTENSEKDTYYFLDYDTPVYIEYYAKSTLTDEEKKLIDDKKEEDRVLPVFPVVGIDFAKKKTEDITSSSLYTNTDYTVDLYQQNALHYYKVDSNPSTFKTSNKENLEVNFVKDEFTLGDEVFTKDATPKFEDFYNFSYFDKADEEDKEIALQKAFDIWYKIGVYIYFKDSRVYLRYYIDDKPQYHIELKLNTDDLKITPYDIRDKLVDKSISITLKYPAPDRITSNFLPEESLSKTNTYIRDIKLYAGINKYERHTGVSNDLNGTVNVSNNGQNDIEGLVLVVSGPSYKYLDGTIYVNRRLDPKREDVNLDFGFMNIDRISWQELSPDLLELIFTNMDQIDYEKRDRQLGDKKLYDAIKKENLAMNKAFDALRVEDFEVVDRMLKTAKDGQIVKVDTDKRQLVADDDFRCTRFTVNENELQEEFNILPGNVSFSNDFNNDIIFSLDTDRYYRYDTKDSSYKLEGRVHNILPNKIFLYNPRTKNFTFYNHWNNYNKILTK